jgi:hypothetical protein
MTNNDEVTHMAQVLAATDLAADLEWVEEFWAELNAAPYLEEAHKLIRFADALAAHRAATAITGKVVPA